MNQVPVFAGLGSDALFSDRTLAIAVQDAQTPEGHILLQACHRIFTKEIAEVVNAKRLRSDIKLEDFVQPESLIKPQACYQNNSVVQHVCLYTIQLLRYLDHSRNNPGAILGVAGFCAGLLPCAVVATSRNLIEFLSRAQDLFYLVVHLGVRVENCREERVTKEAGLSQLPCSLIIDGLPAQDAQELLDEYREKSPASSVYLSSINSETCITLSGKGDDLRLLSQDNTLSRCRIRPINIFSLYHNRRRLEQVQKDILADLRHNILSVSARLHLTAPVFSNIDGKPIDSSQLATMEELCEKLLEMMLLEPVDWIAVEDNILTAIKQSAMATNASCDIVNFGPGYGMSRSRQILPTNVRIVSASASDLHSTTQNASGHLSSDDIAIVGMGVDLPGASDPNSLWANLVEGVNSCTEIPRSRFHVEDFYQKTDGRTLRTKYGNFLEAPFMFDNHLFGISRREARSIDPQQRIMLQTAYRALEDAGYVADSTPSFSRKSFGCFIGNATLDYTDNLRDEIDVYYSPGTLRAFQSGRISYVFKWSGPSITVDTACSSSMVAMHQAARAIQAGDCRSALVGGVNVISSPDMYLGLDRAHFLSPTGQCKPFDDSADGYCRSEGCAAFVVKKLSDAMSEGDRILGVIRGVDINQSGNAHSITHPHAPTQEDLFQSLLEKSRIHPHQVTVVETHGTGTQAGDSNELISIRGALCKDRDPENLVHFTSIKANIGHCEAASGGAALAKLLLMMRHAQIPPQISLKTLNRKIESLGTDGSVIDCETTRWPRPSGHPRIALLNNFGAAGSNGALLLQEYALNKPTHDVEGVQNLTYMLGLSAKSITSLLAFKDVFISYLESSVIQDSIRDIAYTVTARRQICNHRISATGSTAQELAEKLRNAEIDNIRDSSAPQPRAIFAFSGQGSQYLGMGRELLTSYPEFQKVVLKCEKWLLSNGHPGALAIISSEGDQEETSPPTSLLQQSFQIAVFVLEVALARLLISSGVIPTVVLGHSLGEYAALVIAEVIDLQDGLKLVAHRAKLMMELCEPGTTSMLAVNLSAELMRERISSNPDFSNLTISCDNSQTDCVIGGPISELQSLKAKLTTTKIRSKHLDVPMAYHTRSMDPILEQLTEVAKMIEISAPKIPVVSNVFGRIVRPGEKVFTFDYFALHCRQTVAFKAGIDALCKSSAGVETSRWIEIGPHPSILPMLSAVLDSDTTDLLPSLRRGTSASKAIAEIFCHFYQKATGLNWRKIFDKEASLAAIPALPFSQQEFGVYYNHEDDQRASYDKEQRSCPQTTHPFLSRFVQHASDTNGEAIFETPIIVFKDYILGHLVCEYALCPASVYHEIALGAFKLAYPDHKEEDTIRTLSNVNYSAPLIYSEHSSAVIRVSIKPGIGHKADYSFTVASYHADSDLQQQTIHSQGRLKVRPSAHARKYEKVVPLMERQKARFSRMDQFSTQVILKKAMYEKVFPRVVIYSESYQMTQSIHIDQDEAIAVCLFPDSQGNTSGANTILMDVLLHVAGFVANLNVDNDDVCICKEVKSATMTRGFPFTDTQFQVYCSNIEVASHNVVMADAYAVDSQGVVAVFKGMAFQRVKLTRMAQALRLAATRSGHSDRSASPKRARLIPRAPSAPSVLPELSLHRSPDIVEIVASTCKMDPLKITASTVLEAIGFDSLMIIELFSTLTSKLQVSIEMSALQRCETVGDVEQLCGHTSKSVSPRRSSEPESANHSTMPTTPATPATPSIAADRTPVAALIAETCGAGIASVTSDVELEALGIDSLMMIELEARLRKLDMKKASFLNLSECRTVRDIEELTDPDVVKRAEPGIGISSCLPSHIQNGLHPQALQPRKKAVSPSIHEKIVGFLKLSGQPKIVHMPEGRDRRRHPLFLIHDGSGICIQYHRLKPLDRPVYAIHDSKFLDEESWSGIPAMAQSYARLITETTSGPFILGGWSFGGVVAYETARVLMAQGHIIKGVILVDSPPPINHKPLSTNIIDAVTKEGSSQGGPASGAIRDLVRQSFMACAAMLGAFNPRATSSKDQPIPQIFLLRSRQGFELGTHDDRLTDVNVWLQDRSDPRTSLEGWEVLAETNIPYMDIPGDHFQAFDIPNIKSVSTAIAHACDYFARDSQI